MNAVNLPRVSDHIFVTIFREVLNEGHITKKHQNLCKKVKHSRYRLGQAQRVPGN